jgi:MFS family permease
MAEPQPAQAASTGRQRPSTFRALRYRNYRLFFFGQLISLIGTWMQTIAQQYLVYRLTGKAEMLGIISLIGIVSLPLSLWGGSLADRFPKRNIIVVTQTVMMVQAFVMAALTWSGAVQVWQVMVMSVILAAANAVDIPARQAFVVEMVGGKEDLTNAISLNSAVFNGARAIGPAVAGLAVATAGEAGAFFINGLSFIAVIAGLLLMRLPPHVPAGRQGSLVSHLKEGARYVRGQQVVMVLMSMVAVSAFLSMPYSTLLPVFAAHVLKISAQPVVNAVCGPSSTLHLSCQSPDALTYGLLMAAVGLGAVIGALFTASLSANARRGAWLTLGNLAFPVTIILMALSHSFPWTMVLLVGIGFSFVAQNALANTLIQMASPDALRGRVMSFYTVTFQGMMRLGGAQAGFMSDAVGPGFAVGIGGVISLAYAIIVAIRYPKVREMA